jgi:tRNA G46 methylase TrmB
MFQEMVLIDAPPIGRRPTMLRGGRRFKMSDQDGTIVARSSRVLEPFVFAMVYDLVPFRGAMRVLDVGCGSGVYILRASGRNPELTALGLELQPAVAEFACANLDSP